jgi:hypothetical protein
MDWYVTCLSISFVMELFLMVCEYTPQGYQRPFTGLSSANPAALYRAQLSQSNGPFQDPAQQQPQVTSTNQRADYSNQPQSSFL